MSERVNRAYHHWARGPWMGGIYLDYCRKCGDKWHAGPDERSMFCAMRISNRVLRNLQRQKALSPVEPTEVEQDQLKSAAAELWVDGPRFGERPTDSDRNRAAAT